MLKTRLEILNHLNHCINVWRKIVYDKDHEFNDIAPYYLDTFLSIKEAIFGKDKKG